MKKFFENVEKIMDLILIVEQVLQQKNGEVSSINGFIALLGQRFSIVECWVANVSGLGTSYHKINNRTLIININIIPIVVGKFNFSAFQIRLESNSGNSYTPTYLIIYALF